VLGKMLKAIFSLSLCVSVADLQMLIKSLYESLFSLFLFAPFWERHELKLERLLSRHINNRENNTCVIESELGEPIALQKGSIWASN
jgi:hypothetical protein